MSTQEKKLEKKILEIITYGAINILQVISKLRTNGQSICESSIRRMVWRLVDRGQLSFTENRTFAVREFMEKNNV